MQKKGAWEELTVVINASPREMTMNLYHALGCRISVVINSRAQEQTQNRQSRAPLMDADGTLITHDVRMPPKLAVSHQTAWDDS